MLKVQYLANVSTDENDMKKIEGGKNVSVKAIEFAVIMPFKREAWKDVFGAVQIKEKPASYVSLWSANSDGKDDPVKNSVLNLSFASLEKGNLSELGALLDPFLFGYGNIELISSKMLRALSVYTSHHLRKKLACFLHRYLSQRIAASGTGVETSDIWNGLPQIIRNYCTPSAFKIAVDGDAGEILLDINVVWSAELLYFLLLEMEKKNIEEKLESNEPINNEERYNDLTYEYLLLRDVPVQETLLGFSSNTVGNRTTAPKKIDIQIKHMDLKFIHQSSVDLELYRKVLVQLYEQYAVPAERSRDCGTTALGAYTRDNGGNKQKLLVEAITQYVESMQHAQEGLLFPLRYEVFNENWIRNSNNPDYAESLRWLYKHLSVLSGMGARERETDGHVDRNHYLENNAIILRSYEYLNEDYFNNCLLYLDLSTLSIACKTRGENGGGSSSTRATHEEIACLERQVWDSEILSPARAALSWRSTGVCSDEKLPPLNSLHALLYIFRRQLVVAIANAAQASLMYLRDVAANKIPTDTNNKKDKIVTDKLIECRAAAADRAAAMLLGELLRFHSPWAPVSGVVAENTQQAINELFWCYQMFLKLKWRAAQLWKWARLTERCNESIRELQTQFRLWQNARNRAFDAESNACETKTHNTRLHTATSDTLVLLLSEEMWTTLTNDLAAVKP